MSDIQNSATLLKRKSLEESDAGDATKKSKLSFNVGLKKSSTENKTTPKPTKAAAKPVMKIAPVSMKLGLSKPKEPEKKVVKPSIAVSKAFADESDEEEEDMPPEAKMRMKNIGRNTPTSAGPNSFNKSKMGFCSPSAKWKVQKLQSEPEKKLEDEQEKS